MRFVALRPFDRAVAVAKGGVTDKAREKNVKAISTINRFEKENINENQIFLGRNKTKKLDFVPVLEKVVGRV